MTSVVAWLLSWLRSRGRENEESEDAAVSGGKPPAGKGMKLLCWADMIRTFQFELTSLCKGASRCQYRQTRYVWISLDIL